MHDSSSNAAKNAHAMRLEPTVAEAKLWRMLRGRRFEHFKFRRQYPIGPFVLDFYCHALSLAIEIDGEGHDHPFARTRDDRRTRELQGRGIKVIRFANKDVIHDMESVLYSIAAVIQSLKEI